VIPPGQGPFDPGLQVERTALAWRRTCLSLLVGSLAGARILPQVWGPAGLLVAGAGILAALGLFLLAQRRYRMHFERTVAGVSLPDGTLPALTAAAALTVALVALVFILTR
jgi:uncharacterized membrane protein YidH (DUF202 family)